MEDKKKKTLMLNTLLLIFCVAIIALFSFGPNKENKVEVLKEYNIVFDSDGGTTIAALKIEEGSKVDQPPAPTKEGHIFVGWMLGDEMFDFSTDIRSDVTLKAKWEVRKPDVNYYTINFLTNGGTEVTPITVEEGTTGMAPLAPYREGFLFMEWQLAGMTYDFTLPVTSDLTLEAVWLVDESYDENAVRYTVAFNTDGGSTVRNQEVVENGKAKKPTNPTKNGYVFKEWQLDGKKFSFNTAIKENITLVAIWEKAAVTYTVTFNSNGGSAIGSQVVAENGKVSNPGNPTKTGYTFNGWYLNNSAYNFNSPVTGNITLTAQWKEKPVYLTIYNADGSQCDKVSTLEGSAINIPSKCATQSKDGHNFVGWNTAAGAASSNFSSGSALSSDKAIYPAFKGKVYTVVCSKSGNMGSPTCALSASIDGVPYNGDVLLSWAGNSQPFPTGSNVPIGPYSGDIVGKITDGSYTASVTFRVS